MNIILVSNAFVWYFFVITVLKNAAANFQSNAILQIWVLHFSSIAISAVIGAALTSRLHNRAKFLVFWMILGILASAITLSLNMTYLPNVLAISSLLGFSLGIGMPCCMGYFTENIKIESRGRVGGIIFLLSGLGMVILAMASGGNSSYQGLILTVWRTVGLLFFLLLQSNVKNSAKSFTSSAESYRSLFNWPFLFYLIPWIMFSLIAYLTIPVQTAYVGNAEFNNLTVLNNVFIGIFAIVGGFLTDVLGRKRMSIIGFSLLGSAYGVLGLFYYMSFSWYFWTIINGVAWGIFYVIFVVTIWGDLSSGKPSDKYYAVGVLPFFVSNFIQLTIGNNLGFVQTSTIFSFIAFFLFLAVLPLVYASETLPEKIIKERELKGYVEKALKQVQKQANKSHRKGSVITEKENEKGKEEVEESPAYEEARKLAEKYY